MINAIVYGLIAGFATIVGMLLILYKERWAKRNIIYIMSVAAGFLLGAAFMQIIPESISLSQSAILFVLVGFLFFYLIENLIMVHSCTEKYCKKHEIVGAISLIGLGLHSLVDGIAIGIGFEISKVIGIITSIAVIAHEVPEGISSMTLAYYSGVSRAKAILYSIIVALVTPFGAIMAYLFLRNVSDAAIGMLLGIVAGSFIYVSAADLIPETHKCFNLFSVLCLFIGLVASALISWLL